MKRFFVLLLAFAILFLSSCSVTDIIDQDTEEKFVYELIPEILEEFECGLGYGDPEFPEFKSDNMIITDLKTTQKESGDTYKMFYVDGTVTITTLFGTQLELDYQMMVGIDEEFETTGKWYAEVIGGDIFDL